MRLTPHFQVTEFLCKHGLPDWADSEAWAHIHTVAQQLEVIRSAVNRPISVVSGFRCYLCNQECKGARHSQHLIGKAADIRIRHMDVEALADLIIMLIHRGDIIPGGVGIYSRGRPTQEKSFVHYDVRGRFVLWRQRR